MPSLPSEDITRWVKARLNEPLTDDGIISRIELHHAIEGEGAELMASIKVSDDADHLDVAQEIWDAAEEDAGTRMSGRMQRYVMIARWAGSDENAIRKPFLMNGKATMDMMSGDTEGASATGNLGQMMRHSEKLHNSLMQLTEMTAGRLARDLETERKIRMRLEEERAKSIEIMQNLADRQHERDMEIKREEKKDARNDQILALLMGMAPLIASKMLGPAAGALPGMGNQLPAAGARDESFHQLLKNLSEEEIMKIMGSLTSSNQIVMMELYRAHQEQEEERNKTPESETPPAGASN